MKVQALLIRKKRKYLKNFTDWVMKTQETRRVPGSVCILTQKIAEDHKGRISVRNNTAGWKHISNYLSNKLAQLIMEHGNQKRICIISGR